MDLGTLNILAAFFAVLAVAFLWFAVYFLWDIIRMAERLEKRGMGSWGILLALPLGLATPIIISYYLIDFLIPPLEMRLIAFSSLLIASVLILRPVLVLISISSPMRIPKLLLGAYVLVYAVANLIYMELFRCLTPSRKRPCWRPSSCWARPSSS